MRRPMATSSPSPSKSRHDSYCGEQVNLAPGNLRNERTIRSVCFASLVCAGLAAFWAPLTTLMRFSLQEEHYSHIILIPVVSASLFILERKRIFSHVETRWRGGVGLLVAGALFYSFGQRYSASASENDQLAIATIAVVV